MSKKIMKPARSVSHIWHLQMSFFSDIIHNPKNIQFTVIENEKQEAETGLQRSIINIKFVIHFGTIA